MTLDVITPPAVSISDSKENSGLGSEAMAGTNRRNPGPKHHEKGIDDIFSTVGTTRIVTIYNGA